MQRRSRRARLVMLTAVGALLLAAVPGLADPPSDSDTVTINVEAAARTIALNVPEEPATFDITADAENLTKEVTDRSLDYVNPGEDSIAKITVASNIAENPEEGEVDLADLTLAVKAAEPETASDGTAEDEEEEVGVSLNEAGGGSDLITEIAAGANVADLGLTYTLTGKAPDFAAGEDNELEVNVTYTITDDSGS